MLKSSVETYCSVFRKMFVKYLYKKEKLVYNDNTNMRLKTVQKIKQKLAFMGFAQIFCIRF